MYRNHFHDFSINCTEDLNKTDNFSAHNSFLHILCMNMVTLWLHHVADWGKTLCCKDKRNSVVSQIFKCYIPNTQCNVGQHYTFLYYESLLKDMENTLPCTHVGSLLNFFMCMVKQCQKQISLTYNIQQLYLFFLAY